MWRIPNFWADTMHCSAKNILTIPSITVSMGPNIFPKEEPRDLITFFLLHQVNKEVASYVRWHIITFFSFECVKTFLGVTKVMMRKITLMIIKKMIFSTFWVCQSFLLFPSKRRQDLPLRLASQKESLVPGWFLVGWFIGWLVRWLVKKKDVLVLVVSLVPGLFPYFLFSKHSRQDSKSENMLGSW